MKQVIRPQSKRAKDRFGKDDVSIEIETRTNHYQTHFTHYAKSGDGWFGWLQEHSDFIFIEE